MHTGDIYAIGSAFFWSFSIILMRVAGLKVDPLPLNFFKICIGLACLIILAAYNREGWPENLDTYAYFRLGISAVIGISIADTMIAAALNRLGASMQALADCAYSPAIILVGYLMFGEVLAPLELIGGALVVSGVFVGASMTSEIKNKRDLWTGIILAASAHILMAIGILMVRDLYREQSIVWLTGVRFLIAALIMLIWALLRSPGTLRTGLLAGFYRPDTWKTMIPMGITGPFLASLCWIAGFKYLPAGRAAIYNQLSTVFVILMAYVFLKERFTPRRAIGTTLAIAGSLAVALTKSH